MSVDVSTLAIDVKSTGIADASKALANLATAAGNADTKVASLTGKLPALLSGLNTVIGPANGLTSTMALIAQAMQIVASQSGALATSLNQAAKSFGQLQSTATASTQALHHANNTYGVVTTTLKAMATAALAYFSIGAAKHIVEQADAWVMMQAKLKLVTGSTESAKAAQLGLFDAAQQLRVPMEDLSKLYIRLAPALGRLGKSSQDTRDMVEGVALALKLGGASAAEAASTMLQFSQSANAGRLNGAEFNSVAENGVMILRALEDYLGKNQAELKKMGAEGKLTFDIISEAMAAALPKMREDVRNLPMTFSDAMVRIKNSWFKAIGEIGEDTQLGKKLAESVLQLEDDIPKIVSALMTAFNFVIDHAKMLTAAFAGLVAMGVVKWGLEAAAAFTTVAAAATKTTGAVRVLQIAMGFLGGPIGIITGLLAVGITTWALWGDSGQKASKDLTAKTRVDVAARIVELDREIEKLEARNTLMAAGAHGPQDKKGGRKMSDAAQQLLDDITKLNTRIQGPMDPQQRVAAQVTSNRLQQQFVELLEKEGKERTLLAVQEEANRKKRVDDLTDQAKKHFGKPEEKAALEIKDWAAKYKAQGEEMPEWLVKAINESKTHAGAKAMKELNKALKEARGEAERELKNSMTSYDEALAAYKDMQLSDDGKDKRTHAEKMLTKVTEQLTTATDAQVKKDLEAARVRYDMIVQVEQQTAAIKERKEAEAKAKKDEETAFDKYLKDQETGIETARKELISVQDKINVFGKAKGAVDALALSEARRALAVATASGDQRAINNANELINVLEQVQEKNHELGQMQALDKLEKAFGGDKMLDFANDMSKALGKWAKPIDTAAKGVDGFFKRQKHLNDLQKDAEKLDVNDPKRIKALETIRLNSLASEMDLYADLAGSVKGFFKEKTVAYKLFDAFETGLRITQMALKVQSVMSEIGLTQMLTAAKVTGATTSTAADSAATGVSISNSLARAGASTAAGVAKAFEQLGVWGFVGAAAIIAFMASMGVSGGGGGANPGGLIGPDGKIETLDARQKRNNTGTVLGDDTAKSESITKSLESLRDNSNIGLTYTSGMLAALRSIEANIGGLTSSIARVSGITTGKNFGIETGTRSSGIKGLFGKEVTTDILDTGLKLSGTIGQLMAQQYLDIQETTKKSGFLGIGGGTKTKNFRNFQAIDDQVTQNIESIFKDIGNSIVDAGSALGGNAESMRKQLEDFAISTEVSFKDLKGDDLEKALDAVFSATADDMAKMVFPAVAAFQHAGEGYFETLTRVASGTEQAKDALGKLGVTMIDLNSLSQKNGDVGLELVRETLMQQEAGTSLADILSLMDGSMADLIDGYKTLTNLRNSMQATGLGSDLTLSLIKGAGGLDALSSSFSDYFDGFFTDTEKASMSMSKLTMQFGRLNIAVPASKDAFKALVSQYMNAGEAGQEMAGRILALSGDFAEAMDTLADIRKEKIDDSRDKLKDSYDKEAEGLEKVRDKMKDFASSLKDFHDSLLTGDLSTASVMERYQTALKQYSDVSSQALAGDETAISQYQKVAEELLGLSRQVNASGSGYTSDFERVLRESDAIQKSAAGQADQATQQLDLLKKQVETLIDIDDSVKSVVQAITDLYTAIGSSDPTVVAAALDGSHASGLASVPFDGYVAELHKGEQVLTAAESKQYNANINEALVAEIKALREEVKQLKDGQTRQTDALVTAAYDSNQRNAETIVEGTAKTAADTAYSQRNGIGFN